MAAASYYHDKLNLPTKPGFANEMQKLPSPDPDYDRPSQPPQQTLDPHGYAPSTSVPPTPEPEDGRFARLARRKLEKLKTWVRILRFVAQGVTTLFSAVMFAIMIYVNNTYSTTKDTIREARTPWPSRGTKLWPTIMLSAASGLTLVLSLVTLFSYCCCWKRARASWKVTVARYIIHIVGWIIVSGIYRYEKSLHGNENDLWGWTCSTNADDIQAAFHGVVSFDALCRVQVTTNCPAPSFWL